MESWDTCATSSPWHPSVTKQRAFTHALTSRNELRVRHDEALALGVLGGAPVDLDADVPELLGPRRAHDLLHPGVGDVLVVTLLGLGGGREDGLGQPVADPESVR